MTKSQFPFIDFCRQHRCYRELEQYFDNMDKSYRLRMTRLNTLGKLPLHHQFVAHARRFEFITRQLRRAFDAANVRSAYDFCGVTCFTFFGEIRCDDCWYERG